MARSQALWLMLLAFFAVGVGTTCKSRPFGDTRVATQRHLTFDDVADTLAKDAVYRGLLEDVTEELRTFDSVSWSASTRASLQSRWREIAQGQFTAPKTGDTDNLLATLWPPTVLSSPSHSHGSRETTRERLGTTNSTAQDPGGLRGHALRNPRSYAEARLGGALARLAREGGLAVRVCACVRDEFLAAHPGRSLVAVPSLYGQWGIEKWYEFDAAREGRPTLHMVIPPFRRYGLHYVALLGLSGASNVDVRYSKASNVLYEARFERELRDLLGNEDLRGAYVVFGYGSTFEKVLASPRDSAWSVKDQRTWTPSSSSKIQMTRMTLAHSARNTTKRVYLFGSGLTLWGEGMEMFTKALLREQPAFVGFLGSAGDVSARSKIYSVSFPSRIRLDGREVRLGNVFSSTPREERGQFENTHGSSVQTHFDRVHGNSASPAEQSAAWMKAFLADGAETVDVELALVARSVEAHNVGKKEPVLFGAGNLITDTPHPTHAHDPQYHDLDHVDPRRKDEARHAIVRHVLAVLESL